jgi:hypothetical protein
VITVRALEDSGIWEELKTFRIKKENFYREKEVSAIFVATSMLWFVGTTIRREFLHV